MKTMKMVFAVLLVFCVAFLPSAGLAEKTAKVGVPIAITGPYASDGLNYWRGISMAIDEINESGGLTGYKLEAVKFDTQDFAPERVMQAADYLVQKEQVVALHCGWAGWGQDVMAYGKYDVPTFHFDASSGSIATFREHPEKYNNIFQLTDVEKAIGTVYGVVLNDLADKNPKEFPVKRAALMTADDAFGKEMRAAVGGKLKELGWKIALEEEVPYGTTEWRPILSKIKSAKPDLIYMEIVSMPENASFLQQFLESPINATLDIGYTMGMPEMLDVLGKNAEGIIGNVPGVPGPQPINDEAAEWIRRYQKKFDAYPPGSTIWVYYGVMIWADAVRAVGDIHNYKAINTYIADHPHKTIMDGTIEFDDDHKIPMNMAPSYTTQVQKGVKHSLYGRPGEPYKDNKFIKPPWFK